MKMPIALNAILLSASAHVALLWLAGTDLAAAKESPAAIRQPISVRVFAGRIHPSAPEMQKLERNVIRQNGKTHPEKPQTVHKTEGESDAVLIEEGLRSSPAVSDAVLQPFVALEQTEVSEGVQSNAESAEPELTQAFASCSAVILPKNWVHSSHLFPRRYALEFGINQQSSRTEFIVYKMIPEDSELPYADRLIKRTFEDCMNQLGPKSLLALEERFRALNPAATEAYSFKIEFDTARVHAGQSKGI
ncbi:MAG: hypothetical protein RI932_1165 [Pseudomonadota bacterium]|jgi:hypothetical protein